MRYAAEIIDFPAMQDSVLNVMACVIGKTIELPAARVMQIARQGILIYQVRDFYSRHPEKLHNVDQETI